MLNEKTFCVIKHGAKILKNTQTAKYLREILVKLANFAQRHKFFYY